MRLANTISGRLACQLNENDRSALRQKHGERGVGKLKVQARLSESVWPEGAAASQTRRRQAACC
jgi:hypothetical protein